jgi:Uma2 family endonuclease
MTTIEADLQAIREAIRQLSRVEREELAEWILNSRESDSGVAERALAYGKQRLLTVEEYLNLEEESLIRHEYVGGQVFAMISPLIRHETIVANLIGNLHAQLRGGPCKIYPSNTRVQLRIDADDIFYLPDAMVACGPFSPEQLDQRYLTNPCVVFEVLSASTERIDRREKALNYRHIDSLEEYIVIAQRTMEVTIFRRSENWGPTVLTKPEDVYESRAVEVNIALADIYEGTR